MDYLKQYLRKTKFDTIVIHDIKIFNRNIINWFIQNGFHFSLYFKKLIGCVKNY